MTTNAFINGTTWKYYVASSSPNMQAIPEVIEVSGIGQTNTLVDATSFDSTAREYIPGLGDGEEMTLTCIYRPGNTVQDAMVADVQAKATRAFRATVVNSNVSPQKTDIYNFNVAMLSWKWGPQYDDKHTLQFTMKITGAVTIT